MKTYDLTNKTDLDAAAKDSGLPKDLLEAIRFGMLYSGKVRTEKEQAKGIKSLQEYNEIQDKFNKSFEDIFK